MTPELRWIFARAFGPEEMVLDFREALDSEAILEDGATLDLLARISSRTPPEILRDELGEEAQASLGEWFEATAVQVASLRRMLAGVAETASGLGISLLVLKGMAIDILGIAPSGSRPMSDVDILVPKVDARRLFDALTELGFESPFDESHAEIQHLRLLCDPHGLGLEIHFRINNLDLGQAGDLDFDFLSERGMLRQAPGWLGNCFLPSEECLVAHLLVHGLSTHVGAFSSYAPGRILCDLADIGWDRLGWEAFWEGPFGAVRQKVGRAEVRAVLDVLDRLQDGQDPLDILEEKDDPAAVLGHLVAVCRWPQYRMRFLLQRRGRTELFSLLLPTLPSDMSLSARVSWHLLRPFRVIPKFVAFSAGQFVARLRN